MSEWLRPGQHITAMGSDQDDKCELEASCLTRCDSYIPDYQAQTEILGELRPAIAEGLISADTRFPELGSIITKEKVGRKSENDVTIADLTGTGIQDTAIATFAREKAELSDSGSDFES